MTPVPGIAAVEAAAGRQPLATLQALAEAVMREASPAPAATATPSAAVDTVRLQAPAETQAAQRPLEHLLQPAQLSALHAPATEQAHPRRVPRERQRDGFGNEPDNEHGSEHGAGPDADDHDDDPHPPHAREPVDREDVTPAGPSAAGHRPHTGHRANASRHDAPEPEAASLAALLRAHGPADAVADLARGRRVLLVRPARDAAGPGRPAQAWLLDARRAIRFAARWWPATPERDWPAWRLFRDGDPLLARGLTSLATPGTGCRLRLGSMAALRLAGPAPATATLAIHDRQRFADSLGGQWSVVLTVAPPGTGAP